MKIPSRFLLFGLLSLFVCACHFKEPVFTEGFAKADSSLAGVWAHDGDDGDPRTMEFAVCAPIDDGRYVLNYPANNKDGTYYEARSILVRERIILQLRLLATFNGGMPKADDARFTLVWLEKDAEGQKIRVRALEGEALKGKSPADLRKELESAASEWGKLFGEGAVFHRLKEH